jgi:phosphate starvation-inducible PhoH-like protein
VQEILDGIPDVHFTWLTSHDVVRNKLVGRIVAAYDAFEAEANPNGRRGGDRRGHR